jgi:hypothetical protein
MRSSIRITPSQRTRRSADANGLDFGVEHKGPARVRGRDKFFYAGIDHSGGLRLFYNWIPRVTAAFINGGLRTTAKREEFFRHKTTFANGKQTDGRKNSHRGYSKQTMDHGGGERTPSASACDRP